MIDTRTAPYGAFLLRVTLGVMFISHAYLKFAVFTMPGFAGYLAQVGLPTALAWPIVLAEFIGGVAILVGFYGRVVSLALVPLLLGALSVHAPNGWVFNATGGGSGISRLPRHGRGGPGLPGRWGLRPQVGDRVAADPDEARRPRRLIASNMLDATAQFLRGRFRADWRGSGDYRGGAVQEPGLG